MYMIRINDRFPMCCCDCRCRNSFEFRPRKGLEERVFLPNGVDDLNQCITATEIKLGLRNGPCRETCKN